MARYRTKLKAEPKSKPSLLPLWLVLAGLGLVLFAGWAVLNSASQDKTNITVKGAPRLKVQTDTIDRGDIKLGTPVRDDIRVTNIGDQPLRFTEAPFLVIKEGC